MEGTGNGASLPWQGLIVLAGAAAAAYLYLAPLNTSRPVQRSSDEIRLQRAEDVPARLWQDPLLAAHQHEEEVLALDPKRAPERVEWEKSAHGLGALRQKISAVTTGLLVLPVIIAGGAAADYGEARIRARRAVLEGLGRSGFSPSDTEHVGYVRAFEADQSTAQYELPYEWMEPVELAPEMSHGGPRKILVLWLREEVLNSQPAARLAFALASLGVKSPAQVKVIGPRTSEPLRNLVQEAADLAAPSPLLQDVELFSATPSVPDALLRFGMPQIPPGTSLKAYLEQKFRGFRFHRVTVTDDVVSETLVEELARRGVRLNSTKGGRRLSHQSHIALISEWDTFYGRSLPVSFANQATPATFDQLVGGFPENIHRFYYLRGIDGMLPGTVRTDPAQPREKQSAPDAGEEVVRAPQETTEGLNQADYLRRLAAQLDEMNRALLLKGTGGIEAVGVLGSDVYDKLMVLKALRPALPETLFFTNSLDARLAHPEEWSAAHNLIVASPYGLSLTWSNKREQGAAKGHSPVERDRTDLQSRLAPFRDSYQTAIYAATLLALDQKLADRYADDPKARGGPHLFEISRQGAYPLLTADGNTHHMPRRWWSGHRLLCAVLTCGVLLLMSAWAVLVIGGNPRRPLGLSRRRLRRHASVWFRESSHDSSTEKFLFSSWGAFLLIGLFSWACIAFVGWLQLVGGEPYAWIAGISIWPTETIRLGVVLLSIFYIVKTTRALRGNERRIKREFLLWRKSPAAAAAAASEDENASPWASALPSGKWPRLVARLSLRRWHLKQPPRTAGEESTVDAVELWLRYMESGRFAHRLWRTLPLVACYGAASVCFMCLEGWPLVPYRGDVSLWVDRLLLVLSVLASLATTAYVADATLLNRRLIHYLTRGTTAWPLETYRLTRQRRRLRPRGGTKDAATTYQLKCDRLPPPHAYATAGEPVILETGKRPAERPPDELLGDYLDIELIAKRTETVSGLIYYPFVIISLLLLSRINLFDNWRWPIGLLIVIAGNGAYALWSAVQLRKTAEQARRAALEQLGNLLIAYTVAGAGFEAEVATIRETMTAIRDERRGAFAAISQHPICGALLLPSGGVGLWALSQYLPRFFG